MTFISWIQPNKGGSYPTRSLAFFFSFFHFSFFFFYVGLYPSTVYCWILTLNSRSHILFCFHSIYPSHYQSILLVTFCVLYIFTYCREQMRHSQFLASSPFIFTAVSFSSYLAKVHKLRLLYGDVYESFTFLWWSFRCLSMSRIQKFHQYAIPQYA